MPTAKDRGSKKLVDLTATEADEVLAELAATSRSVARPYDPSRSLTGGADDATNLAGEIAYLAQSHVAMQGWTKRAFLIVVGPTFVIGLIIYSDLITKYDSFGSFVLAGSAAVIGAAVTFVIMYVLVTFLAPVPTVRCPYCAGLIPACKFSGALRRPQRQKNCPRCDRALLTRLI